MNYKKNFLYVSLIILSVFLNKISIGADSTTASFEKQNKKSKYVSISFGMGVSTSNNPSLKNFIELDVPNYIFDPNIEKVSEFTTGIGFFGGVEFQIKNNFSIKPEYSYFIKAIDIPSNANYQYHYNSNQPMIMFNYIFSQRNSYIKFALGGGYFFNNFTRKVINIETEYSSSGAAIKFEGIFNAQLGKSAATYFSGFLVQSFSSDLKHSNGNYLLDLNGGKVNLNSFGLGVRLGLEIFIF
ncbi:MAG: hypothetical protein M3R36_06445 [Bacteroidota bacterium]|nr:hypothetical protein [Bacteroidota bacterium]